MHLNELGNRIFVAREEKKLSQEQLANAIGCSQSALSNYEKGKRRIYLSQLEKISEVLEKPLNFFVENLDDDFSEENKQMHSPTAGSILKIINNIYLLGEEDICDLDKYIQFLIWKKNIK